MSVYGLSGGNPEPKPGFVVAVSELPACDFASEGGCSTPEAHFDFRTIHGPWANGCLAHFMAHCATTDLGVGNGQRLVVRS